LSPDEIAGRARTSHTTVQPDRHLARGLEDVSHLFLSDGSAGAGAPDESPHGSARQIEERNELLKRAVADLTLENLLLKEAATRVKELEKENELLKRAVADLTLDTLFLKDAAKRGV
jgi:hypothetical protein